MNFLEIAKNNKAEITDYLNYATDPDDPMIVFFAVEDLQNFVAAVVGKVVLEALQKEA